MNRSCDDEEFEMRHVLARLVEIRLGHHRVLAHDEQRTDSALMRVTENFSGGETQLARETAGLDVPGLLPFDCVRFIIHAHIAGIMERHRAHVAGALHIVLPAQGIQSRAIAPDMTREERQMDKRQRAGGPMRELRDAHAPIDRAVLRRGIHARCFANILRRDTRKFLGIFRRELLKRFDKILIAFGSLRDELVIDQSLFDDDMRHRAEDGHVRPGLERKPHLGKVHQVNAARINDDHLRAIFLHRFLHLQRNDGMILARVRADDHEHIVHDDLRGGVAHRRGADRFLQRDD